MSGIILRRRSSGHRTGGGIGASLWDDDFTTGSALDTSGVRFPSAKQWTKQNFGTSTEGVASGQLSITTQGSGNLQDPRIATESLSGAGSTWRFRCGVASLSTDANYNGLGMVMRESSSGKLTCYGPVMDASLRQLQIRRMTGFTTWGANYNPVATSSPFYTMELEIENDGTNLIYRRLESGVWFTRQTVALTADFTTVPDQIGVWVNGPVSTAATGVFDYWQRVA